MGKERMKTSRSLHCRCVALWFTSVCVFDRKRTRVEPELGSLCRPLHRHGYSRSSFIKCVTCYADTSVLSSFCSSVIQKASRCFSCGGIV